MGEGGFSRAGDSGEADEKVEGYFRVEFADVVAGGSSDLDFLFSRFATLFWDGDGIFSGEPGEGAFGFWLAA